jgi:hypothetical protein
MSDDDIRHWDVGEKRTVRESKTLHGINYAPEEYFGSDRHADDIRIADIEIVEPEREGDLQDLRITWESDVTKHLPERWDHNLQREVNESKFDGLAAKYGEKVITAVSLLLPMGIAYVVGTRMLNTMAGVTVNGEPLTPPTSGELLGTLFVILLLAVIIMYGLKGGFPGYVGGRR